MGSVPSVQEDVETVVDRGNRLMRESKFKEVFTENGVRDGLYKLIVLDRGVLSSNGLFEYFVASDLMHRASDCSPALTRDQRAFILDNIWAMPIMNELVPTNMTKIVLRDAETVTLAITVAHKETAARRMMKDLFG